jgi:hypothetical protein
MTINRIKKMMPVNQRATGFRMNRLKRPRVKLSNIRCDCKVFSGSAQSSEGETTNLYWIWIAYMSSASIFLIRHDNGCPRILNGISS